MASSGMAMERPAWRDRARAGARRSWSALIGGAMVVLAVFVALALVSYHGSDNALNTAAEGATGNWLGRARGVDRGPPADARRAGGGARAAAAAGVGIADRARRAGGAAEAIDAADAARLVLRGNRGNGAARRGGGVRSRHLGRGVRHRRRGRRQGADGDDPGCGDRDRRDDRGGRAIGPSGLVVRLVRARASAGRCAAGSRPAG